MSITNTLYPQGNFLNIRSNAPTPRDYNIQVTDDLVRNLPGGAVKDFLAPAAAATLSLPYDAMQAMGRINENDINTAIGTAGMFGPKDISSEAFGLAYGRERPLSTGIERLIGASGPLADRLSGGQPLTVNDLIGLDYERLRNPISPNQNGGIGTIPQQNFYTSYPRLDQNQALMPNRDLSGFFSPQLNNTSLIPLGQTNGSIDLSNLINRGVANEPDVNQVDQIQGPEKRGLAALLDFLPFGKKSLLGFLADKILPKESPQMKAAKSFYRDQYGLDSAGRVASGIMKGRNPVSGGLLNMITGGKYGKPSNIGLQRAYQQDINRIKKTLAKKYADGDYSGTQLDEKLAELQRLKTAEQMAMERPTIDKARAAASNVYSGANKALGPGGGFSTSGSKKDSGFQSASSKPSGRGRQDY
jgi:hypothetical protein